MKLYIAALAVMATASTLRADDWPLVRHNPLNTGASAVAVKPPLTRVWTRTNATNEYVLVSGKTLLYTAKQKKAGLRDLVAVNADTGAKIWSIANVAQPGAISGSLGLVFTIVRTTTAPTSVSRFGANLWPASIVALDLKTGKRKWAYPIGDHPTYPAVSPLTVVGKTVYLVNIPYCLPPDVCEASLIALNASDGAEKARYSWKNLWKSQVGVVDGPPAIDIAGNRIAVALGYNLASQTPAGQVWVFPADNIENGPTAKLGEPGPDEEEPSAQVHNFGDSWPMFSGSILALQGPRRNAQSWKLTGEKAVASWESRFDKDKAHSLLTGGKYPVVLEYNGGIRLLSAMRCDVAKLVWTKSLVVTGLSATTGNVVYVPAEGKKKGSGVLYALDVKTGKTLWSVAGVRAFNTPTPANNCVYITDTAGTLACYRSSAKMAAAPVVPEPKPAVSSKGKTMKDLKIVAQLYTLRDDCAKDYPGTMRAVAAAGYKLVQVSGLHGLQPRQIREAIDAAGLRCVSTHESYDAVTKDLNAVLARNRVLGAEIIICPFVPGTREADTTKAKWHEVALALNEVGRKVKEAGFIFGYHNHDHEFRKFDGKYALDILMEETNPEWVTLELDAGWAWFAGVDPAEYLRKYAGRAPIIHAKDHDKTDKTKNRPVGDGALNWPPFWDACRAVGTRYAAVEEDNCILPPIESVTKSLRNMVAMGLVTG